jgi:iron complex transport system substrate-binding protein
MNPVFSYVTDHFSRYARLLALSALGLSLLAALLLSPSDAESARTKRIVALTPFAANALADTGKRPAAIGRFAAGSTTKYTNYRSPRLKGVRQLTLSHPSGPNMEQIAQIDPDVVLTSSEWRKGSQTMRDLAITVREMDPKRASDVPKKVSAIGYAYGNRAKTKALVKRIRAEIAYATKGSKNSPHPFTKRPRVLLVLGVGKTPYVFLGNSWGGSIMRSAGASLLGGELTDSSGFAKVSDEYVVAQDPDIIIGVPHGNSKDQDGIREHMLNNPAWSSTKAVANHDVYALGDDDLLQPNIFVGRTIKRMRQSFLKNW